MKTLNRTVMPALALGLAAAITAGSVEASGVSRSESQTPAAERALNHFETGMRHLEGDDAGKAARAFREAIAIDPNMTRARQSYARLLVATGRPQRAQAVLEPALGGDDAESMSAALLLARVAMSNGDREAAIEAFESIRPSAKSESTRIRAHLADLYRADGQYARAAAIYKQLRAIEPNNPAWMLGEAHAQDRNGRGAVALDAWRSLMNHSEALERDVRDYARSRIDVLGGQSNAPYGVDDGTTG